MPRKVILFLLPLIIATAHKTTAQAKIIDVPQEVVEISEELGSEYNICPELIQAICWQESHFQADAECGGCVGIMQVSTKWHKDRMKRLGVTDLTNIRQNMTVAVDYLSELEETYEDIGIVLMVYNGDSSADDVMCYGGDISTYADEILSISAELERENGK